METTRYWNTYVLSKLQAINLESYLTGYRICRNVYWVKKWAGWGYAAVYVHADDRCHTSIIEVFVEK